MNTIKPISIVLISLLTSLTSFQTLASETQGSHEHGSASLDIAIDNNVIAISFESPAVNIVGFEYAPNNGDQQSLITKAKNKLSNFDASFKLQGEPACQVLKSSANWVSEHEEHDEHSELEEHADEALETEHAEFLVQFELQCKQVDKLTAIDVPLLVLFPAINEIDAQVIYSGGQIKQELTMNNTLIKLNN